MSGDEPCVIVKVNCVVRENHVGGMETLVTMELLVGMGYLLLVPPTHLPHCSTP